jgi:hypothetical protein
VAKRYPKQIEFDFYFDRLSAKKLALAYKLLVPDKSWTVGQAMQPPDKGKGVGNDDGSNLCESFLGTPKRRAYHR